MSAYITIRKKFINDRVEASIVIPREVIVDKTNNLDDKIRMENGLLKQDINNLKTFIANVEVEKEEVELRNMSLNETIEALQNKLDIAFTKTRNFEECVKNITFEKDELAKKLNLNDKTIRDSTEKVEKLQKLNDKLEMKYNESEENVIMLENVVETKHLRIQDLEIFVEQIKKDPISKIKCDECEQTLKEDDNVNVHNTKMHATEDVPSTSKCGSCDYESETESNIQMHIESKHEIICIACGSAFQKEERFKTHTCRITVINPSCGDFYTKNWLVNKSCTRIFSKSKQREVLFLHSQQCFDNTNRCPDLPSHYHLTNYDGQSWHAPLSEHFLDSKIKWETLNRRFDINIK